MRKIALIVSLGITLGALLAPVASAQSQSTRLGLGEGIGLRATPWASAAGEEREGEKENIIGAKFVTTISREPGSLEEDVEWHTDVLVGGGLSYERMVIPEHLAIEVSVDLLTSVHGERANVVPVEILLKKPFKLNETIELFIGLGLVLDTEVYPHTLCRPGILAEVGSYFWLSESWGLEVAVSYSLLLRGDPANQVSLAAGPVFRF